MLVRGEGEGASAGGLAWGWASRSGESQRLGETSFLAPLLGLFYSACPPRKRPESGEAGGAQLPTSTLRPHCPVSSSLDSTAIGGMTNEAGGGEGRQKTPSADRNLRPHCRVSSSPNSMSSGKALTIVDPKARGRRGGQGDSLRLLPPAVTSGLPVQSPPPRTPRLSAE